MIAILGGLGAACSWAVATLSSTRSSRSIGARSNLAWVMLVGAAVSVVPAALSRSTGPVGPVDLVTLLLAGVCYLGGLLASYEALIIGRVSIVAPIAATEGSIAAVVAILLGEAVSLPLALALATIAIGVVLAAIEREADRDARTLHAREDPRRSVALAALAAVLFGFGLVATARAGAVLPIAWVVAVPRILGVVGLAIPLALRGSLRMTRKAAPFAVAAGLGEVTGNVAYVIGSQHGIAIASVVASQFAALVAIGGFLLLHERLARIQLAGIGLIFVGVAALAGVRG